MRDGTYAVISDPFEGDPDAWDAAVSRVAAVEEPEDLERTFGPLLDKLLLRRGIAAIDPGSRTMVLATLRDGLRDALENRKRNAAG